MALKIKLPSHCQTLRILFTSSYVTYVNLNRYFQVALALYRWSVTLLNPWKKMFIIWLSRNLAQSTAKSRKFCDIQKKLLTRLDNQLLSLHLIQWFAWWLIRSYRAFKKTAKTTLFWKVPSQLSICQTIVKKITTISRGFLCNVNKDSWKLFLEQPNVKNFARQFNDFHTNIQITELGDNAEFWVQYTNHVKTYA